jgi:hypothetical protein
LRRFFRILYAGTALGQVPFAVAVAWALGAGPLGWWVGLLLAAATTAAVRGRIRLATDDRAIDGARRFAERLYYAHWGGGVASFPVFLLGLPVGPWLDVEIGRIAALTYAVGLLMGLFAVFVRARAFRVRRLDVLVDDLPARLDGYRVAQLSDLHVGGLLPVEVARRWIEATNAAGVDLVALTGDYVTTGTTFHEVTARLLGELRARDGVYAVLGNHDNFGGCEPLSSTLTEVGVVLLKNERALVRRDGEPLFEIAGVDDVYTGRADVERTFAGCDGALPVLTLAHDPKSFPAIAARGSFLVLSGHTHWGQIGVPLAARRTNLARPFFRFAADLHRIERSQLYVHPGLGTTGPPIRFGVPPEIAILTLRRAPGP